MEKIIDVLDAWLLQLEQSDECDVITGDVAIGMFLHKLDESLGVRVKKMKRDRENERKYHLQLGTELIIS